MERFFDNYDLKKLKKDEMVKGGYKMTKRKIMNEAISLAMKINGGAVERCGHGHPTAFIYYSGHINVLEVEIHENGWVDDSDPEKRYRFDFDATAENLLEQLENLREYAEELTKKKRRE